MNQELASKVWNMGGMFSVATPGLLTLNSGNVAFTTSAGELFRVPLGEVKEVKWPFIQFGFGFETTINGTRYKFTFMKPNGASEMDDSAFLEICRMNQLGRGVDAAATLLHMGENKKTAKQWKAVLAGAGAS